MLNCIFISIQTLINVFVFLCNWPDASLEGARGKLIPVVVVTLPSVSQLTTSHSATNSILYVMLICLKIISDLENKGNNSQCRQGYPLLMQKCCFCTYSGYCLLVSQLTTSLSPMQDLSWLTRSLEGFHWAKRLKQKVASFCPYLDEDS